MSLQQQDVVALNTALSLGGKHEAQKSSAWPFRLLAQLM
jgi:hypothetical protein